MRLSVLAFFFKELAAQQAGAWRPGDKPTCAKTGTCSPPAEGKAMAKYLSDKYNAFNASTMSGNALGLYVTMQSGGDLHHYCKTLTGTDDCWQGRADCTLSVALYNRWMMLDGATHNGTRFAHLKMFPGRSAGYVVNTSLVEQRYNKCAYIFDGASSFRLNQGCGDAAEGELSCRNPQSAYYDICPSTNKTCTPEDQEIQPRSNCEKIIDPKNPFHRKWPNTTRETPCYFTGPAFGYPTIDQKYNKIDKMVENRIYNQNPNPGDCSNPMDQCPGHPPAGKDGMCCPSSESGHCDPIQTACNRLSTWNEVVLDLRPMIDDLKDDPNNVIVAFVYAAGHKGHAEILRETFKKQYAPIGDAPLILMDQTKDVTQQDKFGPPFIFEGEDHYDQVSIQI